MAELELHSAKAAKKYWNVYDTAVKRLEKKAQKENAIFDRASENDKHGRKGGLVTIGRKRSIRTKTRKLLNKARANIEAVEKGRFAVGH